MIITISGKPGSGKSTVGKMLAEQLGFDFVSVGTFMGEIAKEHNMTLMALLDVAKTQEWVDKEVDKKNVLIGMTKDNIIVDSRLGWKFIPKSVKIFVDVDLHVAARRIFENQRDDEAIQESVEGMHHAIAKRLKETRKRYEHWYHVDFLDLAHYDIVIDSSDMTVKSCVDKIKTKLKKFS